MIDKDLIFPLIISSICVIGTAYICIKAFVDRAKQNRNYDETDDFE